MLRRKVGRSRKYKRVRVVVNEGQMRELVATHKTTMKQHGKVVTLYYYANGALLKPPSMFERLAKWWKESKP